MNYTNSHILNAKPGAIPIFINDNLVAIPMAGSQTKLMVIHNGSPVKVCRNRQSALTLMKKLKKQ